MPGRFVVPVRPALKAQVPKVDDPKVQRALDVLTQHLQELLGRRSRVSISFDLVVGTNRIPHDLGRACEGYTLTPTVADNGFAHAINTANPRPDLELWITVIGAAQPGAVLEIF